MFLTWYMVISFIFYIPTSSPVTCNIWVGDHVVPFYHWFINVSVKRNCIWVLFLSLSSSALLILNPQILSIIRTESNFPLHSYIDLSQTHVEPNIDKDVIMQLKLHTHRLYAMTSTQDFAGKSSLILC